MLYGSYQPLPVLAKSSILEIRQDSEYISANSTFNNWIPETQEIAAQIEYSSDKEETKELRLIPNGIYFGERWKGIDQPIAAISNLHKIVFWMYFYTTKKKKRKLRTLLKSSTYSLKSGNQKVARAACVSIPELG